MPRDPEKYFFDALDSCRFLIELTSHESLDRYTRDRVFRAAVERELQIIGEAIMQARSLSPSSVRQISEHERIIGFRHVLVHGYDVLNADLVWHVIKNKLPILRTELERLLTKE